MDPLERIGVLEDSEVDIVDAALELAAADDPARAIMPYRRVINEIVAAGFARATRATMPAEQAFALAATLFDDHGFTGDRSTYDAVENANLMDVLQRRRGLPVALSILYIGVGRALGWDIQGLNMPGHFLIRLGQGPQAVLQDPFNDGRVLGIADAEDLLRTISGPTAQLEPHHLKPMSTRAILIRLLNNIATRAEAADNLERALTMHLRMTTIAPMMTGLWWERARLERQLGRLQDARASLNAMLETTHDRVLSDQIRQAIAGLARSLN